MSKFKRLRQSQSGLQMLAFRAAGRTSQAVISLKPEPGPGRWDIAGRRLAETLSVCHFRSPLPGGTV